MPIFALFGNAAVKSSNTRFESTPEIRHLATLIAQLRSKETELAQAAEVKGENSTDHEKYEAIKSMMGTIQTLINTFNAADEPSHPLERKKAIIEFVESIHGISSTTLTEKEELLRKMRNNERKDANKAMQASVAVPFAVGLFSGALFVTTAIYVGATKLCSDKVREWTKLTNEVAMSYHYTKELVDESAKILANMKLTLPRPI